MALIQDEIQEIIASAPTRYTELEVIKLSYSTWPEDLVITNQLEDSTEINIDGALVAVTYIPLKIGEENQDELVSNQRPLTIQGLNDIVAHYEDLTNQESSERIKADILTYSMDIDGNISDENLIYTYYVYGISYSQKNQSATVNLSTAPTNNSETGVKITTALYPSVGGFE